ncbi:MAG TPA: Co2+/Mg2+ efflux protein ApaG [Cryomorphaceae bacterium]|nr:Co2+/Mg2+ efflux protein ApaG [Cryomorphaceae bacterium]
MTTALSSGIKISVKCNFEERFSKPENGLFLFSYNIIIENRNRFPIQLMKRHWYIYDSSTKRREVEGEGVIGVQPVIQPGEIYSYNSSCDFTTDTGKMYGYYVMQNLESEEEFQVSIPSFMMMVPHRLN